MKGHIVESATAWHFRYSTDERYPNGRLKTKCVKLAPKDIHHPTAESVRPLAEMILDRGEASGTIGEFVDGVYFPFVEQQRSAATLDGYKKCWRVLSPMFAHVPLNDLRTGDITAEQANARLSELLKAPVASLPIEPHLERALALATELGHPIYDCVYLALALHYDTHVVTADRRFASVANFPNLAGRVRLLST